MYQYRRPPKPPKPKIPKILYLVLTVILLVSVAVIINYFYEEYMYNHSPSNIMVAHAEQLSYEEPTPIPTPEPAPEPPAENTPEPTTEPTPEPTPTPMPRVPRQEFLDYRVHYGNDNIIGRVWVPDTTINYLVVQGTDNDFYLHYDLRHRRYIPGTIFIDYKADIHNPGDQNWVLFGHNMARNHKFHMVRHFILDEDFFHNNRYIYFSTIYADYKFEVFSAYITHIDFPYINTHYDDWGFWINEFANRSLHDAGISLSAEDRILTLSTCHVNLMMRDYRFPVHAVLRSVTFPHLDLDEWVAPEPAAEIIGNVYG